MSNRFEISRTEMGQRILSPMFIAIFWSIFAQSAMGQIIHPSASETNKDTTLTLNWNKANSRYEVEFTLENPTYDSKTNAFKEKYFCEMKYPQTLVLEVLTDALQYSPISDAKLSNPKLKGIEFSFRKYVDFRLSLPLRNRYLGLDTILIELKRSNGAEIQKVALSLLLVPPPPSLELKPSNENLVFTLASKSDRSPQDTTLRLELLGANKLESGEALELSIASDADNALQFSSAKSRRAPSIKEIFTKKDSVRDIKVAFQDVPASMEATIQISSASHHGLVKNIKTKWQVKSTPPIYYVFAVGGLIVGLWLIVLFLKRRAEAKRARQQFQEQAPHEEHVDYQSDDYYRSLQLQEAHESAAESGHEDTATIPSYMTDTKPSGGSKTQRAAKQSGFSKWWSNIWGSREQAMADFKINIEPREKELIFERQKVNAKAMKEFRILGLSCKPLDLIIVNPGGLTIRDALNKEVGAKRIILSERPGDPFNKIFKVSIVNPSGYNKQLGLKFYEQGSSQLRKEDWIKIRVKEDGEKPDNKPSAVATSAEEFVKKVQSLSSRLDELEQQLELERSVRFKLQDETSNKIEALLKSRQLNDAIRKQVNVAFQELVEPLQRQIMAVQERWESQIVLDNDNKSAPSAEKKELAHKGQEGPVPPPAPLQLSKFDSKVRDVIEALQEVESKLNHGQQDELIDQAILLFDELRAPAEKSSANVDGSPANSGLAARVATMRRGAPAPYQESAGADPESQFGGLVKGQILPIIGKFDNSEVVEMPFVLEVLANICGLQAIKAERNDELNGTYHWVVDRETGPRDRIMKVIKRGFLYKDEGTQKTEVAQKAEVIIGDGRQ